MSKQPLTRLMLAAIGLCAAAFARSQEYSLVDLGPVNGDVLGALAVNNAGQVVGTMAIDTNNEPLAFIWTPATGMQLLGPTDSGANGINEAGQVVGDGSVSFSAHDAFLWT